MIALFLMLPLPPTAAISTLTTDPSDVTDGHHQQASSFHRPTISLIDPPTNLNQPSIPLHQPSTGHPQPSTNLHQPSTSYKERQSNDSFEEGSQLVAATEAWSPHTVVICTLLPYDARWLFSMPRVREAIDVAVGKVFSGPEPLLTGVRLRVDYRDSRCSIDAGIKEAIDAFVTGTVHVFFGPCCDYSAAPVGRQVSPALFPSVSLISPGQSRFLPFRLSHFARTVQLHSFPFPSLR